MVRLAAAAALAVSVALPAGAQGIPKAQSPEEVGFVSTRLKRLSDRIEEGVKNNELPGAVVLIARNGNDLRKVRGEPQQIERAEGDSDDIFPLDAHGAPLRIL